MSIPILGKLANIITNESINTIIKLDKLTSQ